MTNKPNTDKTVELNINGQTVVFDKEYWPIISKFSWFIQKGKNTNYATTCVHFGNKKTAIMMHRLVMGMKKKFVDHINQNGLDNRIQNLRFVSNRENCYNKVLKNKRGYRGVTMTHGKYKCQISANGKKYSQYGFKTEIEAAKAYDLLSLKHHGIFGVRNFPDSEYTTKSRVENEK
jgi:hypothetical protein